MGRTPAAPARLSVGTAAGPHSADSAECQLWQKERRLSTIKASAPTYLPHREAQEALRSSPSWTGGPPLNQAKGKSYAAAVGAPSNVVETSTHPRQPGAEQRTPPSGPKKQDSVKPRPPTKATSESHLDQENTNLRLLLGRLRTCCLLTTSCAPSASRPVACPLLTAIMADPHLQTAGNRYVRRKLPHAHINVADVTGGALECCAVTVRLRRVDTTVACVYVRPGQRWSATEPLKLTARLGRDFLLCGDMNAHHTMWGSGTCSSRGRDLADVIHQLGLQVLNTGSFTFVRRTGRPSCTAIDISLASEGAPYKWTTEADTWGSDHLPIFITPVGGRIPRTRRCELSGNSSKTSGRTRTSWAW
ncbi:hypothetical protein MTO96_033047 [Rhipicephalus appendiculatus]